jgi:flagellar protein FliJ
MARFQFRLKDLLTVRQSTRDECRARLAESLEAERQLHMRRDRLAGILRERRRQARETVNAGPIDAGQLAAAEDYEKLLRGELAQLAEEEQTLAAEIDQRRQAVVDADREVRVLEKLRERQFEDYQKQQSLAETKSLDEIASAPRNGV